MGCTMWLSTSELIARDGSNAGGEPLKFVEGPFWAIDMMSRLQTKH